MTTSSLTWATATHADVNSLAHQFPSFQLSASQAGGVRVEARSPSGSRQDMGVVESGGVYTANFTPTEVGDWTVSIMYEGQHIQGSPFNVRVYDAAQVKVFGLEGGSVGKTFSFSADCSGAGDGELAIDISHNGRTVPANIQEDHMRRGVYRISFTPDGSGIYTIRVYFAGMEVTGSPYTLEIVDSSRVTATGEGLSSVEVNRRATFIVNTHGATGGDVRVNVTSPRGNIVPAQVLGHGDGTFRVEYTPAEVGEYLVDVSYFGKQINGSPYRVHAIDWTSIRLSNLNSTGIVGRLVEFDIDAASAGSGNLEIMVNDGTIPCSVKNRGNRQFHASFLPKEPLPHFIQMKFNGREVPGSPWRVEIRGSAHITASGPGLGLVSVHKPALVDIHAGGGGHADGIVSARISAPSGQMVPAQVMNQYRGQWRMEYVPKEVGNHVVDIMYDGVAVNGSPFTSKAYNVGAIAVGNVAAASIGRLSEFTIDVTQAGEGQLEIMINSGAVPNTVRMLRKGVFLVGFTPSSPIPHAIDIKFNRESLPSCPIHVPVLDASRVTVQGEMRNVAVNRYSSFKVQTQQAGEADLTVRVTSPSGKNVGTRQTGHWKSGFNVEWMPSEVGVHQVDVTYGNQTVPGTPLQLKAYDHSKVIVTHVQDGIVGKPGAFNVDVRSAGEGNLEISIMGGGRNLQNRVQPSGPGKFDVSYTPLEGGEHSANITFNEQHVPGSPFPFQVMDITKVEAHGDGLNMVSVGQPAKFTITAPGARRQDLDIRITSESGNIVTPGIRELGKGIFQVEYMPMDAGNHIINITYMDHQIQNSPFTARAWDAKKVRVLNISPGRINKPNQFNIDASAAGAGHLEIIVSVAGENVPNFVKSLGNANYEVSFTPQIPDTHVISIKFNGVVVPESPFYCSIVDGSRATASGEGLSQARLNKPAMFSVHTQNLGEASLDVNITSPTGRIVQSVTAGNHTSGFRVEYKATEVGPYRIQVQYADVNIQGSPFNAHAFDASQVRVGSIPDGIVKQPVHFDVDCSMAGEGTLTVNVRGQSLSCIPTISPKGNGIFDVMFEPQESTPHNVDVTFNGETVPGSPFRCNILDLGVVNVNWEAIRTIPVGKLASFHIDVGNARDAPVVAYVSEPHGRNLPVQVRNYGNKSHVEFTPISVGAHIVTVSVSGQSIDGSPYTAQAFDSMRVAIEDVTQNGKVDSEMSFTVNTSEAGQGDLDVEVTCNGKPVRPEVERLDSFRYRFKFIPKESQVHIAKITFNYNEVPGSPLRMTVSDPFDQLVLSHGAKEVAVNAQGHLLIHTQGARVNQSQINVQATAPNHEHVPAKMVQQPDGDYKVEYSSKYTGRHKVEIMYAGQVIKGSPFFVEIYDPNKIMVEGAKSGTVGQPLSFEVITHQAGKAELGLSVNSPSGKQVPYESVQTSRGQRITYVPHEPGTHQVFITYGGLEVPGCPIGHAIQDAGTVKCLGEGLMRGEEDKPATFYVDTEGRNGELAIQVDGPNSIAKCRVMPDSDGRHVVTYTPVEVGHFVIQVKWNGREVPGSPWRAAVVCARKVHCVGTWQSVLDSNGLLQLRVGEMKRIQLDVSEAGPGSITAEVHGPSGLSVPVECHCSGHIWTVAFTPAVEGEYQMHLRFANVPLVRSPIMGTTGRRMEAAPAPPAPVIRQVTSSGTQMTPMVNHEKVILTGRGLEQARVKETAEFVIDGTDAGPGTPEVSLSGVKCNIDVGVTQLGSQKYRCTYVPQIPGAYLLNITWSDRQVRGSPFKVNVTSHSDATKVVCTGEGLKMGMMGQEIKSVIDTRRAGPGELVANCVGPYKEAYCELFDHRDGTFTLNVQPQEPGRHELHIKYDGEHVTGSPYTLRVTGAPDASKVRVYGPGVEDGILANYHSRFIVETRGAGAGQLTVRIRGPKGAFRVEMQRESQKDRTIMCQYDPTEVGIYVIHVRWSDKHVPGSPFQVHIFDTQQELERFTQEARHRAPQAGNDSTLQSTRMGEATMDFNTWHN